MLFLLIRKHPMCYALAMVTCVAWSILGPVDLVRWTLGSVLLTAGVLLPFMLVPVRVV